MDTENWTVSSTIGGDSNCGFSPVSEAAEVRWPVGIILTILIVLIALGNSLVIFAVLLEKQLRTFENFFFASLAVADLSIALFVLPLSLIVEMSDGKWHFGRVACDFFIFVDVSCCTASILHLCAIGLNRYYSISSPLKNNFKQTHRRTFLMILSVWSLSFIVASPPLFGWPERTDGISEQCTYDEDKLYIVFSALSSFYIPLLVMFVVYYQIYQLSKKGARFGRTVSGTDGEDKNPSPPLVNYHHNTSDQSQGSSRLNSGSISRGSSGVNVGSNSSSETMRAPSRGDPVGQAGRKCYKLWSLVRLATTKRRKKKLEKNVSEAKTAKTLGLIMTVFVVCWLPFFLIYVIKPFCPQCYIPVALDRSALWLGYLNSLLNPIIYICCKPSFRRTFKKILRMDYCSRYRLRIECCPPRHRIMMTRGRRHIVQQDFSSISRAKFDPLGGQQDRCCCIQREVRQTSPGRCVWMAPRSVTDSRSISSPPSFDIMPLEGGNKRVTCAFIADIPKCMQACNSKYQQQTTNSTYRVPQVTHTAAHWNENVDPLQNGVNFDSDSRSRHRAPGKETDLILNADNSPRIRVLKRRSTWSEPLSWRPRDCSPNRSVCEEADATPSVPIHLNDDNDREVECQTPETFVCACTCTFDGIETPSWPGDDEVLAPQGEQHSTRKETGFESDHENQSVVLTEQNETVL